MSKETGTDGTVPMQRWEISVPEGLRILVIELDRVDPELADYAEHTAEDLVRQLDGLPAGETIVLMLYPGINVRWLEAERS